MRIFAVILATLFLGLNMMPCRDLPQEECDSFSLEENSLTGENEHSSGELCSPFCQQCHCCQVHNLNLDLTEIVLYNPDIFSEIFLHFQKEEEDVVLSHFQPPRFNSVTG